MTSSIFGVGQVNQIIAGAGVTVVSTKPNGTGIVTISSTGGSGTAGVTSFNTRTGAVSLSLSDVVNALTYTPANIYSPVLIGVPQSVTPTTGDSSNKIATTAFVAASVAASTTGVSAFNTRTGAITLTSTDVTNALTYTPANVASPTLTGIPAAPTATVGTSTTQIATTAFVQAAVVAGTAGVASFKSYSGGTPRTGAVTLLNTDVISALSANANNRLIWNASVGGGAVNAGQATSLYMQRNASYGPGDIGGVSGAMYVQSYTPANAHNTYEWGITSEVFSYSTGHIDSITPANGWAPQNVAVNGTIWKRGSAPCWAGNFNAQNSFNSLAFNISGSNTIGAEIDVGGFGIDSNKTTIGVHLAASIAPAQTWIALTSYIQGQFVAPVTANGMYYVCTSAAGSTGSTQPTWPTTIGATVVDGTIVWTCASPAVALYSGTVASGGWQYGHRVLSDGGTSASFYSEAIAPYGFGLQLEGQYSSAIYLANAISSSGVAMVLKAGDAIAFDGTSTYKMSLNASLGLLEFYNGSTRHGYINISSGADVSFNSGGSGGSGVASFNGRTGVVTLTSADITGALGYTPASTTGTVNLTSAQTIAGTKTFSNQVAFSADCVTYGTHYVMSSLLFAAGACPNWVSGGNYGTSKTPTGGYIRIMVDGSPFYLALNN